MSSSKKREKGQGRSMSSMAKVVCSLALYRANLFFRVILYTKLLFHIKYV